MLHITHRMEEIRRLGDVVTVLRDGRQIATHAVKDVSDEDLVKEMVGRPLQSFYPEIHARPGGEALRLEDVTIEGARVGISPYPFCTVRSSVSRACLAPVRKRSGG